MSGRQDEVVALLHSSEEEQDYDDPHEVITAGSDDELDSDLESEDEIEYFFNDNDYFCR